MNLIFDIGCNVLQFAEVAKTKFPQAKIVCVDANKDFLVDDDRFHVIHAAVSSRDGETVELMVDENQTGISTVSEEFRQSSRFKKGSKNLSPNNARWSRKDVVKTRTLDSLIEEFGIPDLIKVDVEGYEPELFKGLTQKVGKICWEWSEEFPHHIVQVVNHFKDLGYKEFGVIGWFDGEEYEKTTHHPSGDAHMIEPEYWLPAVDFIQMMTDLCNVERRVLWGTCWAR